MIERRGILDLLKRYLEGKPLFLVDVLVKIESVILVVLDGDNGVSIDDCIEITRYINDKYDRDQEDYELKVMSAGIGQPFKLIRQFKKNIGKQVCVVNMDDTEHSGVLNSFAEGVLTLTELPAPFKKGLRPPKNPPALEDFTINFDEVKHAKLILK